LIARILSYDLPLNYRSQQQSLLKETDRETLNELAGRLIQPDDVAIIIVGDAATLTPELEQLGIPIKHLDEEGFELENQPGISE
jgi:zinc protease